MSIQIEALLNAMKPRYSKLNEITYNSDLHKKEYINIYFDIFSLVSPYFREEFVANPDAKTLLQPGRLSSNIINTLGYLRRYFFKCDERNPTFSNLYAFYSFEESHNYEDFKKDFALRYGFHNTVGGDTKRAYIFKYIQNEIKNAKIFCEYVSNAYVINSSSLIHEVIPKLLSEKTNADEGHLIVSNNPLFYQYIDASSKWNILTLNGQNSKLITRDNFFKLIIKDPKAITYALGAEYIPLLVLLSGCAKFEVKGFKGMRFKKAYKYILALHQDGIIRKSCSSIYTFIKSITGDFLVQDKFSDEERVHLAYIENNIEVSALYAMVRESEKSMINEQLIDKWDFNGLKRINNGYLKRYPLMLEYIFNGEEI